jgi:hypothetical protein
MRLLVVVALALLALGYGPAVGLPVAPWLGAILLAATLLLLLTGLV